MPPVGRHPGAPPGIRASGVGRTSRPADGPVPAAAAPSAAARTPGEPARHGGRERAEVGPQAVVAGDRDHRAPRCRAAGSPNGSRSPCTTSIGTATASSSASRLGAAPRARRGGCSGNARQTTPAAPVAAGGAAGHARARGPPADEQRHRRRPGPRAGARRPPSRRRRAAAPGRGSAAPRRGRAARRARRPRPRPARPPSPRPGRGRPRRRRRRARARASARAPGTACRWARAGPDGVSISSAVTLGGQLGVVERPGRPRRASGRRRSRPPRSGRSGARDRCAEGVALRARVDGRAGTATHAVRTSRAAPGSSSSRPSRRTGMRFVSGERPTSQSSAPASAAASPPGGSASAGTAAPAAVASADHVPRPSCTSRSRRVHPSPSRSPPGCW